MTQEFTLLRFYKCTPNCDFSGSIDDDKDCYEPRSTAAVFFNHELLEACKPAIENFNKRLMKGEEEHHVELLEETHQEESSENEHALLRQLMQEIGDFQRTGFCDLEFFDGTVNWDIIEQLSIELFHLANQVKKNNPQNCS